MTKVTDALNRLLADYQVLYQKLRSYHWNVSGPLFFGLHAKFEELYTDAAVKVDDLAERTLALGARPFATLQAQLEHARLSEDPEVPDAATMVQNLLADLESLDGALQSAKLLAAEADDDTTANLLDAFRDEQAKTAWMLRAFLDRSPVAV